MPGILIYIGFYFVIRNLLLTFDSMKDETIKEQKEMVSKVNRCHLTLDKESQRVLTNRLLLEVIKKIEPSIGVSTIFLDTDDTEEGVRDIMFVFKHAFNPKADWKIAMVAPENFFDLVNQFEYEYLATIDDLRKIDLHKTERIKYEN